MQGCQALGMYCRHVQPVVNIHKLGRGTCTRLQISCKRVQVLTPSCICGQMQCCYCLLLQLLLQLLVHFVAELLE